MRESIDQGLQQLSKNQGQGGLPAAPASAQIQPAVYTSAAPPPDPNAASELQQAAQEGDQAQSEVTQQVSQESGTPVTTPTIVAGQTISEVEGILGQPTSKALLGPKVVYNYNGMKVTFMGGRVTDVD
jgi:outer membrane receptor protein involved in Fe transport